MFAAVIAFLLLISFIWTVFSLLSIKSGGKITKKAKQNLAKGRVVFYKDHRDSSSA